MKPRDKIKTIRDFEKFLKSRGFSRSESKILARGWKELEGSYDTGLQDNKSWVTKVV